LPIDKGSYFNAEKGGKRSKNGYFNWSNFDIDLCNSKEEHICILGILCLVDGLLSSFGVGNPIFPFHFHEYYRRFRHVLLRSHVIDDGLTWSVVLINSRWSKCWLGFLFCCAVSLLSLNSTMISNLINKPGHHSFMMNLSSLEVIFWGLIWLLCAFVLQHDSSINLICGTHQIHVMQSCYWVNCSIEPF
jgi:hypothetical protein